MRKRPKLQDLRAIATREERERVFREEIFMYLKSYRMMNAREFAYYRQQLKQGRLEDADRIWTHLIDLYAYTRNAVRKHKVKKGQYPEGMVQED